MRVQHVGSWPQRRGHQAVGTRPDAGPPPFMQWHEKQYQGRRLDLLNRAIHPLRGFVVATYALAGAEKPSVALARLHAYALEQGWRVYRQPFWDCAGSPRPMDRIGWRKAERLIVAGFIHGIVTASEATVSPAPAEYEQVLERFESRRTFLAHMPHGWRQEPSLSFRRCVMPDETSVSPSALPMRAPHEAARQWDVERQRRSKAAWGDLLTGKAEQVAVGDM